MNKRTAARATVRAGGTLQGNSTRPRQSAAPTRRPDAPKPTERGAAPTPERAAPKASASRPAAPPLTVAPPAPGSMVGRPATKFGGPGRASEVRGAATAAPRGPSSAHGKEAAARLFGDYSYVKQDLVRIAILTVAALLCLIAISFLLPLWLH